MSININFRDLLPEMAIQDRDRQEIVRNIVDAMQANYELLNDEIEGLLLLTDVDETAEQYLDYIASFLGIELLGLDSIEQKKTLIKNAVAIYKIKGTEQSWEIIFKALGFGADVFELWWDNSGDLTDTDPMLGHLSAGLDPSNPDLTILGRYTVAEFNNPAADPLGRLDAATIAALLNPQTGDVYEVEDTGIILPSTSVVFDDIIRWTGSAWEVVPHYKLYDDLETDLTRPQPFTGTAASVTILDITSPGPIPAMTVYAGSVGVWGNDIEVEVEDGTDPTIQFNLIVRYNGDEVARFDDVSKDLGQSIDTIEATVNTETLYIDIESIDTFDVEKRPATGVYPLGQTGANVAAFDVGAPPRNTKSPYIDIILSVDFLEDLAASTLNKAGFFDGRIKEVKPAHIRIRFKRIAVSITEDANLDYDDDGLTADVFAELVDVLQPDCAVPVGAILVYFHNGFIRSRVGGFFRGYSPEFPDGIPDDPGASSGIPGYVYSYDGISGLTYGDTVDTIFNPFTYGFTFDTSICATDTLTVVINGAGTPYQDDTFYGVTQSARIRYNGVFNFNGFVPFQSSPIDPNNVDGDPPNNADPQGGVTVIRCDPSTSKCITEQDWKYTDT